MEEELCKIVVDSLTLLRRFGSWYLLVYLTKSKPIIKRCLIKINNQRFSVRGSMFRGELSTVTVRLSIREVGGSDKLELGSSTIH